MTFLEGSCGHSKGESYDRPKGLTPGCSAAATGTAEGSLQAGTGAAPARLSHPVLPASRSRGCSSPRGGGRAGAAFICAVLGEKERGNWHRAPAGMGFLGSSAWNRPDFQLEASHGDWASPRARARSAEPNPPVALRRWRWEGDKGHGQGCLVTQRCVLSPRRPGDSQALVGGVCVCGGRGFRLPLFFPQQIPGFSPAAAPRGCSGLGALMRTRLGSWE